MVSSICKWIAHAEVGSSAPVRPGSYAVRDTKDEKRGHLDFFEYRTLLGARVPRAICSKNDDRVNRT